MRHANSPMSATHPAEDDQARPFWQAVTGPCARAASAVASLLSAPKTATLSAVGVTAFAICASATAAQAADRSIPMEGAPIVWTSGASSTYDPVMPECANLSAAPATTGTCVASWQRSLQWLGYDVPITGYYGPVTARFTRDWQARTDQSPNGVVDQNARQVYLQQYHAAKVAEERATYPNAEYGYDFAFNLGPRDANAEQVFNHLKAGAFGSTFVIDGCQPKLAVGGVCSLLTGQVTITEVGSRHWTFTSHGPNSYFGDSRITFALEDRGPNLFLTVHAIGNGSTASRATHAIGVNDTVAKAKWAQLGRALGKVADQIA